MDTALTLKMEYDSNQIYNFKEAKEYLDRSNVFRLLLVDFDRSVLNLLWRLTELSEIPFSSTRPIVKQWLQELVQMTYTPDGFSITGKSDYILACYNGMIASLLIRLQWPNHREIETGIDWIMKYQNVARNQECIWAGTAIKKYGGCMKATPCYIGLVKSVIALSDYKRSIYYSPNKAMEDKLDYGLEYILSHELFKRKSNGKPITSDILTIAYPFSWKTNIMEILRLLKDNKLLSDTRCAAAKEYLAEKKRKDGCWYIQPAYISKNKAWVPFDKIKEPALWTGYLIKSLL